MKINEILTESEIYDLEEGPLLNKVGTAVGKGVGALAKGVGAVAGGVAGLGAAAKKGFQAGKQTVAGAGDTDPNAPAGDQAAADQTTAGDNQGGTRATAAGGQQAAAQPNKGGFLSGLKAGLAGKTGNPKQAASGQGAGAAPAGGQQAAPTQEPAATAADANAQGPKGTAPAKTQTGAAAQAMQKTAQATQGAGAEKAGQTLYAQVKAQVGQLDKKGKQRILQLLQKSMAQPAPADQKAAAPAAEPTAPAAPAATAPAAEPTAPVAEPTAPAAPAGRAQGGGKVAGQQSQTPGAIAKRNARAAAKAAPTTEPAAEPAAPKKKGGRKKPAAASQAEIDADRERLMGPTSDSIIRTQPSLAETFAAKVEEHKRKMFAEGLTKGQTSIFRK